MEKLKMMVNHIAYTQQFSKLSLLQRSLIPLLSLASSFYKLSISVRMDLYRLGFIRKDRLPVPVISVGNLTWGGNGKTPMVEFLALWFASSSISPLVLSRGYAGGDEVKMLQRHFLGTSANIGVGANRASVASLFLRKHGYIDPCKMSSVEKLSCGENVESICDPQKVGLVILDDGMQISDKDCARIDAKIRRIKECVPVYFTKMVPSHFFMANDMSCKVPLSVAQDKVILCISAIGSPYAFMKSIEKLGPLHVDRMDFSDHHFFQSEDILRIKSTIKLLENKFSSKPVIIVTEKDYDRDPEILLHLLPNAVLVLCSRLEFVPNNGCSEESFKILLKQLLKLPR